MGRTYVHALRLRRLNSLYDPVARLLTRERHFKNLLLGELRAMPGESLLDLGCGSGTLALMIKSAHPEVAVHGLDGDADMLARAGQKAGRSRLDVSFHHADARRLPFPDHGFDRVVTSLFLHHLDHASRIVALGEALRVLRPGGHFLVMDWGPAADPLQWLLSWPVRLLDGLAATRDNFGGALPGMIRAAGFRGLREASVVRTPVGTLRMLQARAPA